MTQARASGQFALGLEYFDPCGLLQARHRYPHDLDTCVTTYRRKCRVGARLVDTLRGRRLMESRHTIDSTKVVEILGFSGLNL